MEQVIDLLQPCSCSVVTSACRMGRLLPISVNCRASFSRKARNFGLALPRSSSLVTKSFFGRTRFKSFDALECIPKFFNCVDTVSRIGQGNSPSRVVQKPVGFRVTSMEDGIPYRFPEQGRAESAHGSLRRQLKGNPIARQDTVYRLS